MEVGLSICHAEATQSKKWHFSSFHEHSSCCFPEFVGYFWLQMHTGLMILGNCWQQLQASFLGHDGQFHHQHQRPLVWIIFLYMCYPTFIYAETPMPSVPLVQFCEILQDVVIGIAFGCCKEVTNTCRPGDFVHFPFCSVWMKMLNKTSLSKHSLLPPLHHQSPFICFPALNLLSVQKWTFPSSTWLGFLIDKQGENKIQGFWRRNELLTFIVLVSF